MYILPEIIKRGNNIYIGKKPPRTILYWVSKYGKFCRFYINNRRGKCEQFVRQFLDRHFAEIYNLANYV